jgi:hypothetical protein
MKEDAAVVERLWQTARFLPQSVRLLGTRYRALFIPYAQQFSAVGEAAPVADGIAFVDWMFRQNRVALLVPEQRALRNDERALRRRYRLKRDGKTVAAVEKWKVLQWLRL